MSLKLDDWSDPLWRLSNIYHVTDEDARDFAFKPNEEQLDFYRNLWFRNDILKARQLGFCVGPTTRVLTAGLEWVEIGKIQPGTEVVAVDEFPPGGRGIARRMRTATVQAVKSLQAERFRITFDDGRSVVCTDRHPWLSRKSQSQAEWRSLSGHGNKVVGILKVGTAVRWVAKPWESPSVEDGWFGGMLDGEGSMALPARNGASVNVSQRSGPVWERLEKYALVRGYHARIEADAAQRPSKLGRIPVPKLAFTRMDELFRLIGQTRPTRFIDKHWWDGRELPGKRNGDVGWSAIASIESIGAGEVVDMQTSAGTYIAEGFVSHNTTWCSLIGLDQCLFNENFTSVQIAHTLDDAGKIFRNKVAYAYEHLPAGLIERIPLKQQSAGKELLFKNGSSASVTTSARGGTTQFLHISEFGKIARRYPEKAREILTGSFESVPSNGIIVVESTAEGNAGAYYDITMEALESARKKRALTKFDFRLHFYPWFKKQSYRLDDSTDIPHDDAAYFDKLQRVLGITLDRGQRSWYSAKKRTAKQDMLREYPSTPEEAFQQSVEGSIYADEMAILRKLGRIGKVPVRSDMVMNTFWDLGGSAGNATAIWFHQRYGAADRFVGFMQDTGKGLRHFWDKMLLWQKLHGFKWGTHHLPHDGKANLQGAELVNRVEILESLGQETADMVKGFHPGEVVGVKRTTDLELAIQLTKQKMMGDVFIDEEECAEGIRAMDNYQYEWNESAGRYARSPLHNWCSNPADAFRQWAQGFSPEGPREAASQMAAAAGGGFVKGGY